MYLVSDWWHVLVYLCTVSTFIICHYYICRLRFSLVTSVLLFWNLKFYQIWIIVQILKDILTLCGAIHKSLLFSWLSLKYFMCCLHLVWMTKVSIIHSLLHRKLRLPEPAEYCICILYFSLNYFKASFILFWYYCIS